MFVRAKGVGKGERVVRLRGFFRKLGFEARPLKRRSCFIWKHIYCENVCRVVTLD